MSWWLKYEKLCMLMNSVLIMSQETKQEIVVLKRTLIKAYKALHTYLTSVSVIILVRVAWIQSLTWEVS